MPPNYAFSNCVSSFSFVRYNDVVRKRKPGLSCKSASAEPIQPSNTALLRFKINDFARLSHRKGSFVETMPIKVLDRSWHLRVYPRGHRQSRSDKVLVSSFLTVSPNCRTKAKETDEDIAFSFRIRNWRMVPKRCGFRADLAYGFMGHTRENILQRGLEADGTLVIDVALRLWFKPQSMVSQEHPAWYPNKKQKQNHNHGNNSLAAQLFRSDEFADLSLAVGERIFRVHKCVLAVRAKSLLELSLLHVEGNDCGTSGEPPPFEIPNVQEDVFGAFLDYVYTANEDRLLQFVGTSDPGPAKSLLVVADKFGATELKIFLESVLVDKFLSAANCCEMIILADSHWCALLKEEAFDLFESDPMASIEGSPKGWSLLEESSKLLSELLLRSSKSRRRQNTVP